MPRVPDARYEDYFFNRASGFKGESGGGGGGSNSAVSSHSTQNSGANKIVNTVQSVVEGVKNIVDTANELRNDLEKHGVTIGGNGNYISYNNGSGVTVSFGKITIDGTPSYSLYRPEGAGGKGTGVTVKIKF